MMSAGAVLVCVPAFIVLLRRRLIAVLGLPAAGIGGGAVIDTVVVKALDIWIIGHFELPRVEKA